MENLNLDKFNPTKTELTALVEKYSILAINGVADKVGYEAVDKARKDLKAHSLGYDNKRLRTAPTSDWKTEALRYFELRLTGGDEEAFWKELLT